MRAQRRAGYVLVAVLWMLVAASASCLALGFLARRVVRRALNRRDEIAAAWMADGCIARTHAAIDAVLTPTSVVDADTTPWSNLGRVLERARPLIPSACHLTLRATGQTLDVNTADSGSLARLFQAIGWSIPRADSLAATVVALRAALPHQSAVPVTSAEPGHGAFSDIRELAAIRGLEDAGGLDSLLGVDEGRIMLDRAPLAVVAALPGFSEEAVSRVAEYRLRGLPIPNLMGFSASLSPAARAELLAHYPEIVRATTSEPDAWDLTSSAHMAGSSVTSVIEVRFARSGTGAAIVRRRMWVE